MMRKVVHIITKLEFGGAQTSTLYTVEKLAEKKDYKVFLFTSPGYLSKRAEKLHKVSLKYFPFRREINPFWDIITFILLFRELKKIKPDIVHTHSSKAGILGRWAAYLSGVSLIYHTIHGFPFHNFQSIFLRSFYSFLERITAKITTRLIAITQEDIKKGLSVGIGESQKYILIRDGIDFGRFENIKIEKEGKKKELGIREEKVVGTVACFKPQKNLKDFVKMATLIKVPNTAFVIVGDGELRKALELEIKRSGLEERFYLLGWREDIEEVMCIFDVFVLTSLWEGLPKSLLEAFALGIPAVAYGVDGIKEMIKNGENGFLIPPKDVHILAERVKKLLVEGDLRRKMGVKAKRIKNREEFDIKNMIEKIELLYMAGKG